MGPWTTADQATSVEEDYDRQLQAARDTFPAWEIVETLGGVVAVPRGTEIVPAGTVDGLVRKLRQHR